MTERELLETILQKIGDMDSRITGMKANMVTKEELAGVKGEITSTKEELTGVKGEITSTKEELTGVKGEIVSIKEIVLKLENEHGQKLSALFDGYKLNSEKLDRIESEVTKHEEIILRRI